MSKVSDLHKKWSDVPEYQAAYEELGPGVRPCPRATGQVSRKA